MLRVHLRYLPPMSKLYYIISLNIALSLLISSCSQSKQSQCQKIFAIVNTVSQEAKPLKNQSSDDLQNWLEASNKIQLAAEQIQALNITNPQLKENQENLVKSYLSYSQATRDFVKAFENKDREAAQAAKIKVEEAGKLEQEVGNKLNLNCRNGI